MRDNLFHFAPFSLDAGERVLLRDGRVVPLPAKALSTLLVLVRNSGHVVEKDVLMKEVWPDEYVEEGNLAQHIYTLRKALGESVENPRYLETIPRRGYRFIGEIAARAEETPAQGIPSLAVLPFVNKSDHPGMDLLTDRISEEIVSSLSNIPRLRVMARSTVLGYKDVDPRTAGRSLGVGAVMVGFVQQLGNNIVVSAELVDVEDGSRIWGEHYHRNSTEVRSSQDDLACEISEKLRDRFNAENKGTRSNRLTENSEANEAYLKGRYAWGKRAIEDLKRGVEYFRRAVADDPDYPLANAGIADCLLLLGLFGSEKPREVMPQAKAFAERAIQLDDTLGEAYASLGEIKLLYDWDFDSAELDFQESIRLSPGYPTAHQWYGEFLASMGLFDQALARLKTARDLDPLSIIINTNLGLNLYFARRYDLAVKQLERALELEPNFFRAHLHLGMVFERKQMYREAITELEKARSISENSWTLAALGHCHASFGAQAKAEEFLDKLFGLSRRQFVSCATIAVVYAGFRDCPDNAIEWLEKAYEERSGLLVWLKVWPIFDHLRSDERFVHLLRRIGFTTELEAGNRNLGRQRLRLINQHTEQINVPARVANRSRRQSK